MCRDGYDTPDGIATGMMRELGWEKQVDPANPRRFMFADVPLLQFVPDIEKKLGARTIRVIVPAVPVEFVAAPEPLWSPDRPSS